MIIRDLREIKGTEREVIPDHNDWISCRLLLKEDQMGFSMHDTTIKAGAKLNMWYKNHLEAVYCVSGNGEIKDLKSGASHKIEDGVLYALDKHDQHILSAETDLRMICVFNPPLTGREVHDDEGAYPLVE